METTKSFWEQIERIFADGHTRYRRLASGYTPSRLPPHHRPATVSPRLPWEVIERIIHHSGGHRSTIRNFSLTCRQLRPRSRCVLFSRVNLKNRDHVFAFVDFLHANPYLKSAVDSIVVQPTDFPPFPLLHILPNLSEIGFTSRAEAVIPALHQSTLVCIHRFGTHIQTLYLSHLSFATYLVFARVLLAFPNIVCLICQDVTIKAPGNRVPLDVVKGRLSKQMRLKALVIDSQFLIGSHRGASVNTPGSFLLKFEPDLAPSTVESLHLFDAPHGPRLDVIPSHWPRLQSLVIRIPEVNSEKAYSTSGLIGFLKNVDAPTLREVMLELEVALITGLARDLLRGGTAYHPGVFRELERILLKFPQPGITWIVIRALRPGRDSFWTRELRKHLPVLSKRGTFMIKSKPGSSGYLGHDAGIRSLVVSPNSKWVASGSSDSTIILWNTSDESIAQQWLTHNYHCLKPPLAFSPDSRYLLSLSSSKDGRAAAIWDLEVDPEACQIATLEGHTAAISCCAWSPNGDAIVTGSSKLFDGTVRVWDGHTFQQLHVFKPESVSPGVDVQSVVFSPDGRWLASRTSPCDYNIWAVASGALHKVFHNPLPRSPEYPNREVVPVFGPEGTRLAFVSGPNAVEIGDVETGEALCLLEGAPKDLSFSPDGKLLVATLQDSTLKIWDAWIGVELALLKGAGILKAYFSPCGKYLVGTGEWVHTVHLWRTRDWGHVMTIRCSNERDEPHLGAADYVAFSPDGTILASGGADGTVVIRHIHDIIPLGEQDL